MAILVLMQPLPARVSNLRAMRRAADVLTHSEKKRILLVIAFQIFLNLLDLLGVVLVGVLGALAVTGVASRKPGNRVSSALELIGIQDLSLQHQALTLGLVAAVILVTKTIISVFLMRKVSFFLSRRGALVSSRLLSKLLAQPITTLQSRSLQQTLYLVNEGINAITMGILNTSIQVISDFSLLLILLAGLFIVDPVVAFSTLFIFAGVAWSLYRLLQVRAHVLGISESKLGIENSERILEVLNSYREIITRNRRAYYAREIGKIKVSAANNSAERAFLPNISKYVIELTLVLGTLGISAAQFFLNDAAHAVAVLSVFMAASARIAPAVLRLQQGALGIKSQLGSAQPTLDLIESLQEVSPIDSVNDIVEIEHSGFEPVVNLENVTFSYPGADQPAISGVSFEIASGQVVALVGESGAGKTTLVDLMLGVLEPSVGRVNISGREPIDAISNWPGAIGYVPQDVMVSNGTVRSNIGLGYPISAISTELVEKALEVSQLSDFVKHLPNGIDSQVGDRGTNLSGGQRQRLGIARAMFTQPRLLIFDEATSSLDGNTEAMFTQAIQKLKGNVTVVLIAHRLATVRNADIVIYIDAGKLLAQGTFEEVRQMVPDFDKQASLMGL